MSTDTSANGTVKDQKLVFYDRLHGSLPLYLQVLLAEGALKSEDIRQFIKSNKLGHITLEPYILPVVGKERLLAALSKDFGVPCVDLVKTDISPKVGSVIPKEIGKTLLVACISLDEHGMTLAMADPRDDMALSQVESYTDITVKNRVVTLHSDLILYHEFLYEESRALPINPRTIVDDIIRKALEQCASDIHIEPLEDDIRVRFRKDGMLIESYNIHEACLQNALFRKLIIPRLKKAIPVVVKNKSGASGKVMNNAETQKPQDGRILLPAKNIEMRVSILPSVHGESIAIRILNPEREKSSFIKLGFTHKEMERFESVIKAPYGMVLVSGPTGSGKTTTLYTVLSYLNDPAKKILTVEDPVEYTIQGIIQIQTNAAKGITFAEALRSFLRHDPDIVMVGEIRDRETASMAIEASLTGHLVLSTIHANDAIRTITRIKDLGINPLLLISTCLATMAQRLIRLNCIHCVETAQFSPRFYDLLEHFQISYERRNLCRSRGCPECSYTGFQGRTGIYELMVISPQIQQMILNNATDVELEALARAQGMRLLIEDALMKAAMGLTTEEEILRVTMDDYGDHINRVIKEKEN